ncbi:MAG: sodium:solute symporter family protein, partial [Planctomycetales bacterium]|nr:sodium:solute symporter family protein [Planctomycetales bacterium]
MNDRLIPFGPGAQAFILVYLFSLIVIGAIAYRARRDSSLKDFYLAGKGIGFVTLLLTLYSTQYSGNTLFGFTGATYRIGYSWAVCIHFMTSIVVVYLAFAPGLYRLAKQHHFITPVDYLDYRFGDWRLSLVSSIVMIGAISNYLLAQLMAMGSALEGLTDADPVRAYRAGVVVLALVIVVYESLGGFRAVAWTDVIQGTVLGVGFVLLLCAVCYEYGSIQKASETLLANEPAKFKLPEADWIRTWFSYVLVVGLGGALYPQSIQRIYAAKSAKTLQRSLRVMAFLPLTTTLIAVIVGIYGAANFPGLTRQQSDTILTVVCRQIQQESLLGYWLVVVLFSAVLAAIMSTADSVLLSISSMVTKDIYAKHCVRYFTKDPTQTQLTWFGKAFSWVLMASLVIAALRLRGKTLVELLDYKFDLLVQLSPAFILSLHWRRMSSMPTLIGMVVGVAC